MMEQHSISQSAVSHTAKYITLDPNQAEINLIIESGMHVILYEKLSGHTPHTIHRAITIKVCDDAQVTFMHNYSRHHNIHISLSVELGNYSTFIYQGLLIGSVVMKAQFNIRGEYAHADIRGVWLLDEQKQVNMQVNQNHYVGNSSSTLQIKSVLRDYANACYMGNIFIAQHAQRTNASQTNKNIVLSEHARAISIPTIEVLADDVQCTHGSAIGQLDAEQLWYAQTRGLSEKVAQRLLLHGFLKDLFTDVDMHQSIEQWLDKEG